MPLKVLVRNLPILCREKKLDVIESIGWCSYVCGWAGKEKKNRKMLGGGNCDAVCSVFCFCLLSACTEHLWVVALLLFRNRKVLNSLKQESKPFVLVECYLL